MSNDPDARNTRSLSKLMCYEPGSPDIPSALWSSLDGAHPQVIAVRGDIGILDGTLTGFFCSIRCPADIILTIYDLARSLRGTNMTIIGGFQTPMEKEFLDFLLRGSVRVVVSPARSIQNMLVPQDWRTPISEGRLLILSPFGRSQHRPTAALASQRNDLVAALAADIFIPYAAPGGKTESLAHKHATAGKVILTVDSPTNANLLALGARAVEAQHSAHRQTDSDRLIGGSPSAPSRGTL